MTKVGPEGVSAVQSAIREREDGFALAMSFDPGTVSDSVLNRHAIDVVMGLLYVRGWRPEKEEMLIGMAEDWADRWWQGTLGPDAFIVESPLWPNPQCEVGDLTRIKPCLSISSLGICRLWLLNFWWSASQPEIASALSAPSFMSLNMYVVSHVVTSSLDISSADSHCTSRSGPY